MQWIVIAVLIIIVFIFLKFDHHARKIKILVLILLVFFLYLSISNVFSSEKVSLNSPKGIINAVYYYFGWLGNTVVNLWDAGVGTVKTVGSAVKINNTK
jgi:hypothetical protein